MCKNMEAASLSQRLRQMMKNTKDFDFYGMQLVLEIYCRLDVPSSFDLYKQRRWEFDRMQLKGHPRNWT